MGLMPAEWDGIGRKDMGCEWDCESNPMQNSTSIPSAVTSTSHEGADSTSVFQLVKSKAFYAQCT